MCACVRMHVCVYVDQVFVPPNQFSIFVQFTFFYFSFLSLNQFQQFNPFFILKPQNRVLSCMCEKRMPVYEQKKVSVQVKQQL